MRNRRWGIAGGVAVAAALFGGGVARAASVTLPGVTIGLSGTGSGPGQVATSLDILLALTVLSLAPAILLLMTSFTRIVVVLGFARSALGSSQLPPNQVLVGLALFLTLFVMSPTIQQIYTTAWKPYAAGSLSLPSALATAEKPLEAFMLRQTRTQDISLFESLEQRETQAVAAASGTAAGTTASGGAAGTGTTAAQGASATPPGLQILLPAFVVSELRTAFEMGFILYVPFMVIDLVVASTLMAMGMIMLPPTLISLPFKILLFVLVDGWSLLAQSLVASFH